VSLVEDREKWLRTHGSDKRKSIKMEGASETRIRWRGGECFVEAVALNGKGGGSFEFGELKSIKERVTRLGTGYKNVQDSDAVFGYPDQGNSSSLSEKEFVPLSGRLTDDQETREKLSLAASPYTDRGFWWFGRRNSKVSRGRSRIR